MINKNKDLCSTRDTLKKDVDIDIIKFKQEFTIMCTVTFKAITEKNKGNSAKYNELVDEISRNNFHDASGARKLRLWIMTFSRATSLLDESCGALVNAILKLDWTGHDNNLVVIYVMFLANLISSHSDYMPKVLVMLVNHFVFRVDKNGIIPSNLENIHGRVHYALKNIFPMVPSGAEELFGILSRGFPHKSESLPAQVTYLKNLLQLLEYIPCLQGQVLELIFNRIIELDTEVQGKIDEIEDMEDASTKYELSLHSDQGSQSSCASSIYGKSRFNSPTDSYDGDFDYGSEEEALDIEDSAPSIVALDIGEMIEKLDCMIKLVFDYLKWCFDKGTKDERDDLFDILLTIFEENILYTFKSRYIQFIIFWYISLDKSYPRQFLSLLLNKILNDKEPVIIREAASQYIGSFVGRANYLSSTEIRLCIQALLLWTERYIENYEPTLQLPDPQKHMTFYSIVQTLMYIFCFRWKDLREVTGGIPRWCYEVVGYHKVINSSFRPLQVCSKNTSDMFQAIVEALQFMNFEKQYSKRFGIIEQGILNITEYFPFDPFRLKTSQPYIEPIYRDWAGMPDKNQVAMEE
ncbi:12697_t:CDS:2 [Dentiscutata erythropus]|uniref:12697_t:CDS:1 n=1 Tax=Dentiscutata erythropus TaxID=1348616 RepID=A0A9N8YZ83_9GLOM|nr:12697_t:CDS:2 [Dentiscutata erythropus]